MTKIFICNFPNQAQTVRAVSMSEKKDEVTFHVGYDNDNNSKELLSNALSSFFCSLIIHDEIYVKFDDLYCILHELGIRDTLILLDSKIIRIIPSENQHVIMEEKSTPGKLFLGSVRTKDDAMTRFEKRTSKDKSISSADRPCLIQYADNARIEVPSDIPELARRELKNDLERKVFSSIGLETTSLSLVNPKDALKLLRLAGITDQLVLQSKLGIDSIVQDGFVKKFLELKAGYLIPDLFKDTISPFSTIANLKGIPDIYHLYKHGTITLGSILACRETFSGGLFRRWYSSTDYNHENVLKAFLQNGAKESAVVKFARLVYPNVIGLVSPLAGFSAGTIDSYIVSRLLDGWNPSLFLDNVLKHNIDQQIANAEASEKRKKIIERFGKVDRNAPCPCQSGKKFKRCHGA